VYYLQILVTITVGVLAGIFVGSIPGLTATMAIALLVPMTFYMEAVNAISLLLAIYVGAMFGGSISAILLGIPGTPAATATRIDGFPMSKQGRAGEAINIAAMASFVGGMVSLIILFSVARPLARFSLNFQSPEYFALAITGLTLCISLSSKNVTKGLVTAFLGLFLATIGLDELVSVERFTFGRLDLFDGLPFIPAMIGFFGFAELLVQAEQIMEQRRVAQKVTSVLPTWNDFKAILGTSIRGGLIGTMVGAIPGTGGNIAAFLSYDITRRLAEDEEKDKFGEGHPQGVAAAESGNNGVTGGAIIPLVTFGIPGDSVTAVLLGSLLIHGLRPGKSLFEQQSSLVNLIFAGMLISNILMLFGGIFLSRFYAKILSLKDQYLLPIIAVLSIVGAYSIRSSLFDVGLMLACGVIGYLLTKTGYSTVPLVLGIILGPTAEMNFRRALLVSGGSLTIFFTRPISLVLLVIAIIFLTSSIIQQSKNSARQRKMRNQAGMAG